jgi:hypothetical protein
MKREKEEETSTGKGGEQWAGPIERQDKWRSTRPPSRVPFSASQFDSDRADASTRQGNEGVK